MVSYCAGGGGAVIFCTGRITVGNGVKGRYFGFFWVISYKIPKEKGKYLLQIVD